MKRTSLTTAVIAGIAGVAGVSSIANAVYLNNDGLGQALIYPYYTINNGQSTVITVINTTNQAKAVKVRFLEAYNSREVLDFNLYLSRYDFWTGQISQDPSGTGGGYLTTNDNSCTVPQIPSTGQPFLPYAYTTAPGATVGNADGGPTSITRTAEGYAEIIEMGTVIGNSAGYVTHANGVPANCAAVQNAWNGGYWAANSATDITAASGGLFGSGTIVNVQAGTVFSYNADAVDQFYLAGQFNHQQPGNILPNLAGTAGITSTVSYVFAPSTNTTVPVLATTDYGTGDTIDAVTSVFMADSIYNEIWADKEAFQSEWVVTFPTKRFYVDPQILGALATAAEPPFTQIFKGTACEPIAITATGREEERAGSGPLLFSPPPPGQVGTNFCYEANVLTFNQSGASSAILGSAVGENVNPVKPLGWAQVSFDSAGHTLPNAAGTVGAGNVFSGLPAIGFWVTEFTYNGVQAGVLANYTSLYRHKMSRLCNNAANAGSNNVCS